MALIIEDGSGKSNADSYATLAEATDYWSARENAAWMAATDERREAALRNAFDYLGYVYRWPGQPRTIGQRGAWPRSGVPSGSGTFPTDAIPTQVIDAQLLLASEDLTRPIMRKPEPSSQLVEKTTKVRGIEKTQKWQVGGEDTNTGLVRLPLVDVILQGIVIRAGANGISTVSLVKA